MNPPTPENVRYHAAGHIAAAEAIAHMAPEAAKVILAIVQAYVADAGVSAPPAVKQLLDQAHKSPGEARHEMRLLEEWFCHPLNTVIERTGIAG